MSLPGHNSLGISDDYCSLKGCFFLLTFFDGRCPSLVYFAPSGLATCQEKI
jgi:hypothetical protein